MSVDIGVDMCVDFCVARRRRSHVRGRVYSPRIVSASIGVDVDFLSIFF